MRAVQDAQQAGTFETLMTGVTSPSTIVMLTAASSLMSGMMQLFVYLAAGLFLFGTIPYQVNWLASSCAFALSLFVIVGLGMLAAALQISIQKGSALLWFFGSAAWFLTGTLFPVSALPKPLRFLSNLIPLTHSLNAMRMGLLQGASFSFMTSEMLTLALFAVVLLPIGLLAFSYAMRRARFQGTLAYY